MSTEIGRQAEAAAVRFLRRKGFRILAQNWRTRWCEIDIIAQHKKSVHFVEVKYRSTYFQGNGLDYITTKKLQQMGFAAEMWLQANSVQGLDYYLAAVEVSGPKFMITQWLNDL